MKRRYLALAIVGAILLYIFFYQYFTSEGLNLGNFIFALFENGAAGGFAADLLFPSLVYWISMFSRRNQGKGPKPVLFMILNLTIGLSCAAQPTYARVLKRRVLSRMYSI